MVSPGRGGGRQGALTGHLTLAGHLTLTGHLTGRLSNPNPNPNPNPNRTPNPNPTPIPNQKYVTVRTAAESDDTRLPPRDEWELDARASYRYICSNETVGGTEFWELPAFDDGAPLPSTNPDLALAL